MGEENNVNQDADFLKEKIKQRPLNKKKLLRRTLITALMAVLFGTIACLTFLLLEPVISNKLYPEEETELIEFPEEIIEEEILPEDMIADETQMQAENGESGAAVVDDAHIKEIAAKAVSEKKAGADDYISMNNDLLEIAREARKAMVTVTGVTSDVDWFNNAYESKGQTAGSIVWDNGKEYLILVNINTLKNAEVIKVTFADGTQYEAEVKKKNKTTGLAVLAVTKANMEEDTIKEIKVIELGSSSTANITGTPIIAIGRVVGNTDSICYGFITSSTSALNIADAAYKLITTDIYGSSNGAGILINMRGQAVGIIDNSFNGSDAKNIVSAIGISELRQLIQKMSNDMEKAYMGIHGTDVTSEAYETLGVPLGAYVTEIEMDSPAMDAGVQSGDVIVKIGETGIVSFYDYAYTLFAYQPEQTITLQIMRQGPDGYRNIELTAVLGHSE